MPGVHDVCPQGDPWLADGCGGWICLSRVHRLNGNGENAGEQRRRVQAEAEAKQRQQAQESIRQREVQQPIYTRIYIKP
jgi:hypothetical protein